MPRRGSIRKTTLVIPCLLAALALEPPAANAEAFFPDYADVVSQLEAIASDHPAIASLSIIGQETHGTRELYALKISDNVATDEDEPAWLFNGFVHGAEQIGLRILLDLAEELTTEYGSDAEVTDWVDAYEVWIVVAINSWGYDHGSDGASRVKGTRKDGANTGDVDDSGVDLARNYDFRWTQGGSTDPEDSRFRGPTSFSENETQAMRNLARTVGAVFGITYHQGNDPEGGQIMRPWSTSGISAPPDSGVLQDYAADYADWVMDARNAGPICDGTLVNPDGDGALVESTSARADASHACDIVLLSDGQENEAKLWSEVEANAQSSSCLFHVVALGPETDEPLLQEISRKGTATTDDDGSYHYATLEGGAGGFLTFAMAAPASGLFAWNNGLDAIYDAIAARQARRQRLLRIDDSIGSG